MHRVKSHKSVEQIAKKHRLDVSFVKNQLEMGIPIEHEHTKDRDLATDIALQHLDEIPDYYTRLKKMESSAKKEHKKFKDVTEGNLHKWFKSKSKDGKPGWVNVVTGGTCASDEPGEGVPKCVSSEKRASMSKAERLSAARRKKAADPRQQEKTGAAKPTYVSTDNHKKKMKEEMDLQEVNDKPSKGSGKKDACYHKVRARYDVWPSAYASGALVKCRQKGAANWGTKKEEIDMDVDGKDDMDSPMKIHFHDEQERYCPGCQKNEKASQCKYGKKYWKMFSHPIVIAPGKDFTANTPHPGNFPESYDHEHSMARSEISTIISAAKRLKKKMKGEGNIEAWVQSKITKAADYLDSAADYVDSGEMKAEGVSIEDADGNHYVDFIDIIKPEPLKPSKGIGSALIGEKCWDRYEQEGMKKKGKKLVPNCVKKEEYSNWREELTEDWQKVNRQDKTDGLSQAAVNAYRRENPGSKLQTAVTEKKPKGKRAQRRKNFCSRMSGMKKRLTSAKTAHDPDSRINKALRRWRCR